MISIKSKNMFVTIHGDYGVECSDIRGSASDIYVYQHGNCIWHQHQMPDGVYVYKLLSNNEPVEYIRDGLEIIVQ